MLQDDSQQNFFTGGRHNVDVIAHRGGNGEWPGETLFAFRRAKELGVDVLEMDIRVTRDEQLVMMHNPTVVRTTQGWLPVRCYTLAEIQKLNAGYDWSPEGSHDHPYRESQNEDLRVPSFEQVLERFSDMRMNVEIKGWHPLSDKKIAEQFCRLIDRYGMIHRVLVASFHGPVLRVIRSLLPEVAISASTVEVARFVASSRWGSGNYRPNATVIQTCSRTIDSKLIQTARKHGLKLHGWTVNEETEMDRLIELGVDGIITDFPSRLLGRPGLKSVR
ncbi:MAG TPA: glycerophosphodiester phosphodiesterase [Pyrinomonadaceae bacterium]|jgi:glycerophosphoryl diester phosphodiesterase